MATKFDYEVYREVKIGSQYEFTESAYKAMTVNNSRYINQLGVEPGMTFIITKIDYSVGYDVLFNDLRRAFMYIEEINLCRLIEYA